MKNLRKLAKNQQCQIRIPGVCSWNDEETVLAHISGAGIGIKQPDILGAWACSRCHDAVDFRRNTMFTLDELQIMHYEGMVRTIKELIAMGIIEF